jgi:hypothetical protein
MKKASVTWPCYLLVVLLALLYNDWLLGYLLNPHMSANRSLISELSASNQPHHWIFRSLDITAGIITLAFAHHIWKLATRTSRQKRLLLTTFFAVVGLDSIIDACLPIACAPSVNPHCSFFTTHSTLTTAHLIESNIAGIAIALAPAIWWWWHREGEHEHIARASLWLVMLESAIGVTALVVRFDHLAGYGTIQRIYQGGVGTWVGLLVYLALELNLETEEPMTEAVSSFDGPAVSS